MSNQTQIERYKQLLSFIDENFKENINIEKVEAVCNYSYRNINRIFEALHHETIGKYIKRLRLEKAAQYLKYSNMAVAEIGFEVGFEERAAFSKAFKNKYGCSPSAFRTSSESIRSIIQEALHPQENGARQKLQFEIEYLPDFEFFFLEYRGDYEAVSDIEAAWEPLIGYTIEKELVAEDSIFMAEILDDAEISDKINLRYHLGCILKHPLTFTPDGLFRTKFHRRQKYAKFTHLGTHESCIEFYKELYAFWMLDVDLELVDRPTLEWYPNQEASTPPDEMLTVIYIPVQ
ncbi:MAG: AraC family transcriptional regulator [Bacteroidota bacterium]